MPLMVVARMLEEKMGEDQVMGEIARFARFGFTLSLYKALSLFGKMAFDDIETMLLEVSKHFEEGAKKYGENNWQKGIPVNCYLDSAIRHYLKWRRGDKDEPHDLAFCWNIMCCIWEVDYHEHQN